MSDALYNPDQAALDTQTEPWSEAFRVCSCVTCTLHRTNGLHPGSDTGVPRDGNMAGGGGLRCPTSWSSHRNFGEQHCSLIHRPHACAFFPT